MTVHKCMVFLNVQSGALWPQSTLCGDFQGSEVLLQSHSLTEWNMLVWHLLEDEDTPWWTSRSYRYSNSTTGCWGRGVKVSMRVLTVLWVGCLHDELLFANDCILVRHPHYVTYNFEFDFSTWASTQKDCWQTVIPQFLRRRHFTMGKCCTQPSNIQSKWLVNSWHLSYWNLKQLKAL